jgi:hypothetical protein
MFTLLPPGELGEGMLKDFNATFLPLILRRELPRGLWVTLLPLLMERGH